MVTSNLLSDVGELKGKVEALSSIANKLDTIIERLVDQHDRHIVKVYDDIEKRRMENQEQIKEIHDRIDMVLEKIEKLQTCILEHNSQEKEQLDNLLKWKWMLAGGIIALSWLISHVKIDILENLIK